MRDHIAECADTFADFYQRRAEDQWGEADICALIDTHPAGLERLREELAEQHGVSVTLQTLRNYARVAKSFSEEHRLPCKWTYFLECSLWENPVEALQTALDGPYSPGQMTKWRRHGDPEYKEAKPELCQVCGGDVSHCHHEDFATADLSRSVERTRGAQSGA